MTERLFKPLTKGNQIMKKLILTTAVCTLLSGAVLADQGPWLIRARAVGLDMANKDSTSLGLSVPSSLCVVMRRKPVLP